VSDELEIDVMKSGLAKFSMRVPGPFTDEQLAIAMEICNRHFGDVNKQLGAPRLAKEKNRG